MDLSLRADMDLVLAGFEGGPGFDFDSNIRARSLTLLALICSRGVVNSLRICGPSSEWSSLSELHSVEASLLLLFSGQNWRTRRARGRDLGLADMDLRAGMD